MEKSKKFNKRAFVAMMVAFTGIGLPISGVANHLYQFESLTVARHAWMAVHNILSILFLGFAIWHIVINRRAMVNHVKGFNSQYIGESREALLAVVIVTVALLFAVGHAFLVK